MTAAIVPTRPKPIHHGQPPEPDYAEIRRELQSGKHVTLQLLWAEYRERHPDGYRYSRFCELYKTWLGRQDFVLRQEHRPGEKLFVDYAGDTVTIHSAAGGETLQAQIFVAVSGASNYTYAEATATQGLRDWIGAHLRAFEFLGAVPQIVVPDNLKSGVTKPCRYEPGINRTYEEMAGDYGVAVVPARSGKPRDKAKVEVGVLLVERWILAALRKRTFFSLGEVNQDIAEHLTRLNNGRGLSAATTRRGHPRSEFRGEIRINDRPPVELEAEPRAGQASARRPAARPDLYRGHQLPRAAGIGPQPGPLPDRRIELGPRASESVLDGSNRHRQDLVGAGVRAEGVPRRLLRVVSQKSAEMFRGLATARADGSHAKLLDRLGRVDRLIVDDWAMVPLTDHERRDFLEICDGRYQMHSTLLTSQLPVANWHAQIGDPTIADSILDRLVHNAHRIDLAGDSLRKDRAGKIADPQGLKATLKRILLDPQNANSRGPLEKESTATCSTLPPRAVRSRRAGQAGRPVPWFVRTQSSAQAESPWAG